MIPEEKERFTYKDYLEFGSEVRCEIIGGQIYDMTPAPSTEHQRVSGKLFNRLTNLLKDSACEVFAAPFDVRFPENAKDEDITDVVQPDIVVICEASKLDKRGCLGAPDLVIEILSPSTASKDYLIKQRLYKLYGVPEYWIVNPETKVVTVLVLKEGEYEIHDVKNNTEIESKILNLKIGFSI